MCMASTRAHALAHAGWFTHWPLLCRVAQHQPNKYRSKTIQKPSNNHTTTVQQPYNNRTKTVQKPVQQPPAKTHPPAAPNIAIQNEKPWTPWAAPAPPLATLRYGAAREAGGPPEGPPPPPPDPKGGAGATPRHPAPRRGEGGRRPTRRAAPTVKKVTPLDPARPLR